MSTKRSEPSTDRHDGDDCGTPCKVARADTNDAVTEVVQLTDNAQQSTSSNCVANFSKSVSWDDWVVCAFEPAVHSEEQELVLIQVVNPDRTSAKLLHGQKVERYPNSTHDLKAIARLKLKMSSFHGVLFEQCYEIGVGGVLAPISRPGRADGDLGPQIDSGEPGENESSYMEQLKNSDTFQGKSTFAQSKYLLKKRRKKCPRVFIHRPTARLLIQIAIRRSLFPPGRHLWISETGLAQIMAQGNVQYGGRYLIADDCAHALILALLSRVGSSPDAKIVNLGVVKGQATHAQPDLIAAFNHASRSELSPGMKACQNPKLKLISMARLYEENKEIWIEPPNKHSKPATGSQSAERSKEEEDAFYALKRERFLESLKQRDEVLSPESWHGIFLATRADVLGLVKKLEASLKPSCPLVVFHETFEALLPLYHHLLESPCWAGINMTSHWTRPIHTAHSSFHPHMQLCPEQGTKAFILVATKLCVDSVEDTASETQTPNETSS